MQISSAFIVDFVSKLRWISRISIIELASDFGIGPMITEKLLSSTFGGTIATRQIIGEKLLHRPEKAIYQITFQPISNEFIQSQWQTVGSVALQSNKYSLFQNIFDTISTVLIRESGF